MIRFAMLGSGSKGNATLVQCGDTTLLLDCGFRPREAIRRLERLGLSPESLSAIVVTHEHDDHLGGVTPLARRYELPVWATPGTFSAWREPPPVHLQRHLNAHDELTIDDLHLSPMVVPHDAREPCQFIFSDGQMRIGVLSDAGHVTPYMRAAMNGCDALLLEFNHDPDMLAQGPYPSFLKRRVGGNLGHLSNRQSTDLLKSIDLGRLRHLVATHVSEANNTTDHVMAAAAEGLGSTMDWVTCADQAIGLDWREVR